MGEEEQKPLYKDNIITIDYPLLPGSIDDHALYLSANGIKLSSFRIPRGVLEELAKTPRGGIERKISAFNEIILASLKDYNVGIDGLHVAICQAYAEEDRRRREFIKQQSS